MPKVTITFNLPEEKEEHLIHVHAMNLCLFVGEVRTWLRNQVKYSQSPDVTWEKVQEEFFELARPYEFPSEVL